MIVPLSFLPRYVTVSLTLTKVHEGFKSAVHKGNTPDSVIAKAPRMPCRSKARIGLIGHPYLLYDRFINMDLIKKLRDRGVEVITPDMIDPHIINERCMELSKRMFWSSGKSLIGSALYIGLMGSGLNYSLFFNFVHYFINQMGTMTFSTYYF